MARVNPDPPTLVIGLDVGGTKIAAGIIEFPSGRILTQRLLKTKAERDGAEILRDVLRLAADLMKTAEEEMKSRVLGIGLGVAELVDLQSNITSGHTIGWKGLPVWERLSGLAPAVVESDVRAAALAEAVFGAGRGFRHFVYVTVGTGISSCLVQDGHPYAGSHGNALILASSPLTSVCTQCGSRLQPVLEEFASGPALLKRYNGESSRQAVSGEDVCSAAASGDPAAIQVVTSAGEALGVSLAFLINTLDPEAVIVGGGLGSVEGLYWQSFVKATRTHIWVESHRNLPILHAALGTQAGLIGAAANLWKKVAPGASG